MKSSRAPLGDYLDLFKTKTFVFNTAGMAAVTFATGAYAAWGSTFYQRDSGLSATEAGKWIGLLLVAAGLIGIGLGMVLPDLLRKLTKRAYLLLCAFAVLGAIPLAAAGILYPRYGPSLGLMFVASILMAMVLGPSNTVTANVVPAHRRAMAYSAVHILDSLSRRHQLADPGRARSRRRLESRRWLIRRWDGSSRRSARCRCTIPACRRA